MNAFMKVPNSPGFAKNNIKIFIPYVEFQFENFNLINCDTDQYLNISFVKSKPKCFLATSRLLLYDKLATIIDSFYLNTDDNIPASNYGMLDYFFYPNPRLPRPSSLFIYGASAIINFNNYINTAKTFRCSNSFNVDECSSLTNSNSGAKISNLINNLKESVNSLLTIDPETNNVELVDLRTQSMYICTYFISTDYRIVGRLIFTYLFTGTTVSTGYTAVANSIKIKKEGSDKSAQIYYEPLTLLCVFFMLIICYLKNYKLGSFSETLNRSFFFVLFLIGILIENVFKIYHLLIGSNDYVFIEQIFTNQNKLDLALLYSSNVRIIKSLAVLCICYHLVYVVFTIKDLVVFTIFLKPVFQRFFIVLILIIIAFSIMITIFIGGFYVEFNTFYDSFFNSLNYALGIAPALVTDESTLSYQTTQLKFYFQVVNWALKLIVFNFTMITMFYFYRKMYIRRYRTVDINK